MSDAPIGVFDSGIGGLTVLRALQAELPAESFIYLGDTARLPYGTKSAASVVRYARQATAALGEYGVKCLVVACNTAAALGLPAIRDCAGDLPVVGVVEPGAAVACASSRSGRIGVIATEATVRVGAYQDAIRRLRADATVSAQAAQLLVALAEEGLCDGPIALGVAHHYLDAWFAAETASAMRPDTLVLGCTHFPMLAAAIRAAVGPAVTIVDSAAATAKAVRQTLEFEGRLSSDGASSLRLLATDGAERFARVGARFLRRPIACEDVELVDL